MTDVVFSQSQRQIDAVLYSSLSISASGRIVPFCPPWALFFGAHPSPGNRSRPLDAKPLSGGPPESRGPFSQLLPRGAPSPALFPAFAPGARRRGLHFLRHARCSGTGTPSSRSANRTGGNGGPMPPLSRLGPHRRDAHRRDPPPSHLARACPDGRAGGETSSPGRRPRL